MYKLTAKKHCSPYFCRSGHGDSDLVSAINDINHGVARGVFLMGGKMEEKYDEEKGVGNVMVAVVGSAEKLVLWTNQIYQEEGNHQESFNITVDQYLEAVDIFLQSLSPKIEETNDVSQKFRNPFV